MLDSQFPVRSRLEPEFGRIFRHTLCQEFWGVSPSAVEDLAPAVTARAVE